MKVRITSKNQLDNILKENGYVLESSGKHEKWVYLDDSVTVPRKHSKRFSRMLAERVVKQAKYIKVK